MHWMGDELWASGKPIVPEKNPLPFVYYKEELKEEHKEETEKEEAEVQVTNEPVNQSGHTENEQSLTKEKCEVGADEGIVENQSLS